MASVLVRRDPVMEKAPVLKDRAMATVLDLRCRLVLRAKEIVRPFDPMANARLVLRWK